MAKRITSHFENENWNEVPNEPWGTSNLSNTSLDKTFTGEIVGTSKVESIMLRLPDGPMAYVGIERFDVKLDGKTGGFVLMHDATMIEGKRVSTLRILEGSGTGELAGITGTGEITPEHDFNLTYDL